MFFVGQENEAQHKIILVDFVYNSCNGFVFCSLEIIFIFIKNALLRFIFSLCAGASLIFYIRW